MSWVFFLVIQMPKEKAIKFNKENINFVMFVLTKHLHPMFSKLQNYPSIFLLGNPLTWSGLQNGSLHGNYVNDITDCAT